MTSNHPRCHCGASYERHLQPTEGGGSLMCPGHSYVNPAYYDSAMPDVCGVQDVAWIPEVEEDHIYGTCTLPADHEGDWHQEWRDGKLWAEWSAPSVTLTTVLVAPAETPESLFRRDRLERFVAKERAAMPSAVREILDAVNEKLERKFLVGDGTD